MDASETHQVIIIGGGQAGLATAFYLRRFEVEFLILDDGVRPGGSWNQIWPTMTLFSTSNYSSLPGKQMRDPGRELGAEDVIDYFSEYEHRYDFPIRRPVSVDKVFPEEGRFRITTDGDTYFAENVVMATGTQSRPVVPSYPGTILGQFWHTANYPGPDLYRGKKVAIMGAGNSGAQLAAELSEVAEVQWLVREEPKFMPDDVDGAELFRRSRARALAVLRGESELPPPVSEFGDIVMTEPIRRARDEGRLTWRDVPESLDELDVDHFIWATGYEPALRPIRELLDEQRRPTVEHVHLVGYGEWTGPGSATITGVGPFAKRVAEQIAARYR